MGMLVFLPPVALWVFDGKSAGAIILALFGLIFIALSSISILKALFPESRKGEKFPKPEFGPTRRSAAARDLTFGTLFLFAFVEQIDHLTGIWRGISIDEAKTMLLLAILYLLFLITVARKQQNDGVAWTYELETDMVLGAISPEVAIRKIENRRLGPRLQDVMDRFFDDLDQRFAEVDSKLEECTERIRAAMEVPEQYPAERAARINLASMDVAGRIDKLTADCNEFRDYLVRLEQKHEDGRKAVPVLVLASLKARHEIYDELALGAKRQLKTLIT